MEHQINTSYFTPEEWARRIRDGFNDLVIADTLWSLVNKSIADFMKLNRDLEAFYIAVLLQKGTSLKPVYGYERVKVEEDIADFIRGHPGKPAAFAKLRRNYVELGGNPAFVADDKWFYQKLAGLYVDWVYQQEDSLRLQAEALEEEKQRLREPLPRFVW